MVGGLLVVFCMVVAVLYLVAVWVLVVVAWLLQLGLCCFLLGAGFGVWVVSVSVLFWLRACLYVLAVGFRWFRFVA